MKFIATIEGGSLGKTTIEADLLEEAEELARSWVLEGYWPGLQREEFVAFTIEDEDGVQWEFDQVVHGYAEPDCADGHVHNWNSPHRLVGGSPRCSGQFDLGDGRYRFDQVCRHCGRYRSTVIAPGRERRETYRMPDKKSLAWVARCASRPRIASKPGHSGSNTDPAAATLVSELPAGLVSSGN